VIFGPWFLGVANTLKKFHNHLHEVFYATSTTSEDLGVWFDRCHETGGRAMCGDDQISLLIDEEYGVVYAEGDGSRHDAHMHRWFIELKWLVYILICGGWQNIPKSIFDVVRAGQEMTIAKARFMIKYWHPYRVRSGDCDTSGGNTVMTDFVAFQIKEKFHEQRKLGKTLEETAEAIEIFSRDSLGYSLKLNLTLDSTRITFLSGLFVPVDGKTFWCPLPGKLLAKIGWTITLPGKVSRWQNLAGTLNSFKAYKFVPFVRVYLESLMNLIPERYRLTAPGGSVRDRERLNNPNRFSSHVEGVGTPDEPGHDTWTFFEARYGLSQKDEAAFQVELDRVTAIPFMLESYVFSKLVEVDVDL
jgi:hypothetical protein